MASWIPSSMIEPKLRGVEQNPDNLFHARLGLGPVGLQVFDDPFALGGVGRPRQDRTEQPIDALLPGFVRRHDAVGKVAILAPDELANLLAVVQEQMLRQASLKVPQTIRRLAKEAKAVFLRGVAELLLRVTVVEAGRHAH